MPEDVELAPDWLQEEIQQSKQDLQDWLVVQDVPVEQSQVARRGRHHTRGRRPSE